MTTRKKFYVTTAIDYPNAEPHIGHAYQKVLADVLARWHKTLGEDVWFLTGTDEHGKKIQECAEKEGKKPEQFVDELAEKFKSAWKSLNVDYDRFIRTTDSDHQKLVQDAIKKCDKKGDIYKGFYEGFYCVGCEAYYTEKDLVDGKCPLHNRPLTNLKEESYFFRLSKYEKFLLNLYEKNPEFILPKERRNEIKSRVKEGLKDLSISRTSFDWGIPFPLNKKHITYVWFDALFNYVSGAGKNKKYWPANIHLLGKDNAWFHCVYWPAFLKSAGYELPKTVYVHGFLTFNGQKISKSLGNAISPVTLVENYGSDSVRYFIARHFVFGEDGDFSEKALVDRHNNELADKLGNLVARVSSLIEKNGIKKCENKLLKKLKLKEIEKLVSNYEFDKALNEIFAFIDVCNEYVQKTQPWKEDCKNKEQILYELADSIKASAILLWPFIPSTSEKIAKQFSFKIGENSFSEIKKPLKISKIKKGEILFKKIEFSGEKNLEQKKVEQKIKSDLHFDSYKSYLMGASKINDRELKNLGIKIVETKSDGDRLLIIPNDKIENYLKFIELKLDKGFWNEVVGNEIIFVFKFDDGKVKRFVLNDNNSEEIARLCSKFNGESYEKTSDLLGYLLDNEFYSDYVAKMRNKKINKPAPIEGVMTTGMIGFSDWEKLDLRVAQIKKVEDIEGADKLYKLTIDVGELGERVICAGMKPYYAKEKLKDKKIIIVANLEPRTLRGIESKGMLLAAGRKEENKCVLLTPDADISNGSKIS